MTGEWKPRGAAAKLAYIQAHVANPDKTGRNEFHKFDYIQEHGLIELLRPMLRELHCAVVASPAEYETRVEEGKTPKGRDQKLVTLVGELTFIDTDEPADSPDREVRAKFTAAGADDLDKAHAKAQTILVKYGLQKLFLIPTEKIEDGDATAGDEPPTQSKPASRPKPASKGKSTPKPADAPSVAANGPSGDANGEPLITTEQLEELASLYREKGSPKAAMRQIMKDAGAQGKQPNELTADQGNWVILALRKYDNAVPPDAASA